MQTKTTEWGCKKKLGYPLVRRRPGSHARMAAVASTFALVRQTLP